VIGGPLTAAVFDDTRAEPLGFLTDRDAGWRRWVPLPNWLLRRLQ